MAEIHEEMSELVDKQVNVQKESLKKLPGFTQNSRKPTQSSRKPTKKCAMKMKERNKQTNKETKKKKRRAPKILAVDIEPKVGSIRAVVIEPKVTCALFWDLENF